MARVVYSAIMSLDGYVADEDGEFDWAVPREEVDRFVNDLERRVGTYLSGRRMYEGMVVREDPATSPRTRIERAFDPAAVREMKARSGRDLSVGGGRRALPRDVRLKLELLDERRFGDGMVCLCYDIGE
jgi:dihydrofolate reductase